jgi:hypothetical protein
MEVLKSLASTVSSYRRAVGNRSIVAEVIVDFRTLKETYVGRRARMCAREESCLSRLTRDVPERWVVWSHQLVVPHVTIANFYMVHHILPLQPSDLTSRLFWTDLLVRLAGTGLVLWCLSISSSFAGRLLFTHL